MAPCRAPGASGSVDALDYAKHLAITRPTTEDNVRRNDLYDVVGDTTHDLAEKGKHALYAAGDYIGPRAHDLAEYLGPRVHDLAENVSDYVAPRVQDLAENVADYVTPRVQDLAENVADYLEPRARELGRRGVQFASEAAETLPPRVAQFASDTRGNLQPYVEDAVARVQPLVDTGLERFNSEVLPRLADAYENVAAMPATQEARKRLTAAAAALAGELSLPEPEPRRSPARTILKVVLAGGLLAGVAYGVRRFLAPPDSGWQAHEPSDAYRSSTTQPTSQSEGGAAETSSGTRYAADDAAPTPEAPASTSDPITSPYGEGSYVGAEPPAGFVIKGNERSMKYHVQGTDGYERTIPDVWFESEDAAQAAGFTRAQR